MILLRVLVAALVLLVAPASARAQGAPAATRNAVGVIYTRGPGAEGCPDEQGVRESIVGRVGSAVEIVVGSTVKGPKKIGMTITRGGGSFVSRWDWIDGDDPRILKDENCYRLVERTALSIAVDIKSNSAPAPPGEPELPPPAPKPAPQSEVPPSPTPPPPPPAPPPRPGVFDGTAGIVRIVGFGVAGTGAAIGAGFGVASQAKAAQANLDLNNLVNKTGGSPCFDAPSRHGACGNVAQLRDARDSDANIAEAVLLMAGAIGVATTASIWLIRTPGVQVKPTAPGSVAGLTLQRSW